jgi:hypothetical protein
MTYVDSGEYFKSMNDKLIPANLSASSRGESKRDEFFFDIRYKRREDVILSK